MIVALDYTTLAPALRMARQLQGLVETVKVGSVLFTACGPLAIQRMQALGFRVMLDLKFLDIPSTVEQSCRAATAHRVSMITVHASGEPSMLTAAVRGVREEAKRLRVPPPLLLGVTVLTSVGQASPRVLQQRVLQRALAAEKAGCDGVVASAHEAPALRKRLAHRTKIICPGIRPACAAPFGSDGGAAGRPAHAANSDQQRVVTPREALARGADALVIGRPITAAMRPRAALQQILDEMRGGEDHVNA